MGNHEVSLTLSLFDASVLVQEIRSLLRRPCRESRGLCEVTFSCFECIRCSNFAGCLGGVSGNQEVSKT